MHRQVGIYLCIVKVLAKHSQSSGGVAPKVDVAGQEGIDQRQRELVDSGHHIDAVGQSGIDLQFHDAVNHEYAVGIATILCHREIAIERQRVSPVIAQVERLDARTQTGTQTVGIEIDHGREREVSTGIATLPLHKFCRVGKVEVTHEEQQLVAIGLACILAGIETHIQSTWPIEDDACFRIGLAHLQILVVHHT